MPQKDAFCDTHSCLTFINYLHGCPCGLKICCCERLRLLLKLPGHADEVVRHHIELIQQQCVRWRQVSHPQRLLIGQEGVSLFVLLPTADDAPH